MVKYLQGLEVRHCCHHSAFIGYHTHAWGALQVISNVTTTHAEHCVAKALHSNTPYTKPVSVPRMIITRHRSHHYTIAHAQS